MLLMCSTSFGDHGAERRRACTPHCQKSSFCTSSAYHWVSFPAPTCRVVRAWRVLSAYALQLPYPVWHAQVLKSCFLFLRPSPANTLRRQLPGPQGSRAPCQRRAGARATAAHVRTRCAYAYWCPGRCQETSCRARSCSCSRPHSHHFSPLRPVKGMDEKAL